MTRKDTILVTGGAGFIGANLIRRLSKNNPKIHLIVCQNTNIWRLNEIESKLFLHRSNLLDLAIIKRLIRQIQPTLIFHLAAHGSYSIQTNTEQIIQTNILGTLHLLEALQQGNYRAFINTGSSSEYGTKNSPMSERDNLEPLTMYAASKASATLMCRAYALTYQKPIVTLRPFSIYGPWEEPTRFIPTVITSLLENKTINLTAGVVRRDFVYVDDMIDAYIKASEHANRFKGEVFNIGTGKQHSNDEVIKLLATLLKTNPRITKGTYPRRSFDTETWIANNSSARKKLEWIPKHSLIRGLEKMIKWIRRNEDYYPVNNE